MPAALIDSRIASMRHIPRADRWRTTTSAELRGVPSAVHDWLSWPDSLTERVATHLGGPVQIRVLSERTDRILSDEKERLHMRARTARIREVQLQVRGETHVIARTVFPEATARVMNDALRRLGNRSLGSLLFGVPRAPVTLREWIALKPESSLWQVMRSHLPGPSWAPRTSEGVNARGQSNVRVLCEGVPQLWARRAVHLLAGEPLLVCEIFMPWLLTMAPARTQDGSKD